jgi:hypothetical protein
MQAQYSEYAFPVSLVVAGKRAGFNAEFENFSLFFEVEMI